MLGNAMTFQPFDRSRPIYFLGCQICPNCRETMFAAESAEVDNDAVSYRWTCDVCGHGFSTTTELAPAAAA
jgi:ssDNA-binding Zn-finger/Zn-ribbon topoisomerase 1